MGIFGKPNIGKLRSKGDVKGLHKVLVSRGSSLELVIEAAIALLDLDATDVLREALHHELSVYSTLKISKAFAELRDDAACPILYDLWLNYENPSSSLRSDVRVQARSDLSRIPCTRLDARTEAALVAVLRDQKSRIRAAAAHDLKGVRDADAVAALVACLRNGDESVRLAAAEALTGIDDPEARAALIVCLRDEAPNVRAAVAWVVGEDSSAVTSFVADLRNGNPALRLTAIGALSALGSAEAVEPIAGLLTDPDPSVRSAAANALAGFGDRRGSGILIQIAETGSKDWEERARAIESLGRLGTDVVPTLVKLLHDGSLGVKSAAAKSLARLGWVPTMDEAGAYYFLATGEVDECLHIGAKATLPLMEYLPKAIYEGMNIFSLLHVAEEVADRRIVPTLQDMLKKEQALGIAANVKVEKLERAIAGILVRAAPVAGPEWIELMNLAAMPLGEALVQPKLGFGVTCPSCGGTMVAKAALRPAASFLVCPRCGDDWLVRFLTGKYWNPSQGAETLRG